MSDSGRIAKGSVKRMLSTNTRPGTLKKVESRGYRCPRCNKKLADKMPLWRHYELEPNCGDK